MLAIGLAIVPLLSYAVTRLYYKPSVTTRIGSQDDGGSAPLPSPNDRVWLGVSTNKNANVLIREVWVKHKSSDVEIQSAVGEMVTGFSGKHFPGEEGSIVQTFDRDFPAALRFTGSWIVTKSVFKLFPFSYKAKDGVKSLDLQILVYAKIDDADVGFPWDMVGPKTYKTQSAFKLTIEDFKGSFDDKLKRYGFQMRPKETFLAGYSLTKERD